MCAYTPPGVTSPTRFAAAPPSESTNKLVKTPTGPSYPPDRLPPPAVPDCRHGPVQETRHEIEALREMLAEMERQEMALLMRERLEAEQAGRLL